MTETDWPAQLDRCATPEAIFDLLRDALRDVDFAEEPAPEAESAFADAEALLERAVERLVTAFPEAELRRAVEPRLRDLARPDAPALLRVVETLADAELLGELGRALLDQPRLAPERAWEALTLLRDHDVLDRFPDLEELLRDIEDLVEEGGDLVARLVEQIDDEPDGKWLALRLLEDLDSDERGELLRELVERFPTPGALDLLRLSMFSADADTVAAARDALESIPDDIPGLRAVWLGLHTEHWDEGIVRLAESRLRRDHHPPEMILRRDESNVATGRESPLREPEFVDGGVTSINGEGIARILLVSGRDGERFAAAFTCDVTRGIVDAEGVAGVEAVAKFRAAFLAQADRDVAADARELAEALLAGGLLLDPGLALDRAGDWLRRLTGPGFRPRPFSRGFPQLDLPPRDPLRLAGMARAILAACPSWLDRSPATVRLADELALRGGSGSQSSAEPGAGAAPAANPARDAALFRLLFEKSFLPRLETCRRMLYWMSAFWNQLGETKLAEAALIHARRLSDPQNAVSGDPFIREWIRMSVEARVRERTEAPTSVV